MRAKTKHKIIRKLLGERNLQFHYSQFGEDIVIAELLSGISNGFYVDVGAFDPKKYSNTWLLYEKGWSGINIDPNRNSIEKFRKMRPRDINLNLGISDISGKMNYYQFNDPAVNTLSEDQAEEWKKKWRLIETSPVEVKTLGEILDKNLNGREIDFLNVDAEGHDIRVLRSNNFNKYRPFCIAAEMHGFSMQSPESSEVFSFLSKEGYKLVSFVNFTGIFVNDR